MRHLPFAIAALYVSGQSRQISEGSLTVHHDRDPGAGELRWDVQFTTLGDRDPLELRQLYALQIDTAGGRRFGGVALVVRRNGPEYHLDGWGGLEGIGEADFADRPAAPHVA